MTDGTSYETKSVRFNPEDGVTMYRMMITAVEVGDNQSLGESGFSDRVMFFTLLEAKPMEIYYDPYRAAREMNDDMLKEFMVQVKRSFVTSDDANISWSDLEDGGTYSADQL